MTDESETQLTPDHMGAGAANILLSAFPHLAAKLAERATGVAGTSSGNTVTNYLAQYLADLPEFWRNRERGSLIPLVARGLHLCTKFAGVRGNIVSVCGMLKTGRRNRMRKSLRMRAWLKVNFNEICDLQ